METILLCKYSKSLFATELNFCNIITKNALLFDMGPLAMPTYRYKIPQHCTALKSLKSY